MTTQSYEFSRSPDGLPIHTFVAGDVKAMFYVSQLHRGFLVGLFLPKTVEQRRAMFSLTFDDMQGLIEQAAAATGAVKIGSPNPEPNIMDAIPVIILFPGQPPTIHFSDERWFDGKGYQGISLSTDVLRRLEEGRDLGAF